ncbi:alpha-amylase family glycosyl hydrolase [Planomicrobium sp. CPCC 101079]|uniref:alpha-amylase family glycosyl hydrolase n=1 Tax=Planomicrobium sp. CPCC 101079 TaxID=2599618 RepID=UPI0011B68931|nr:alpha-amylase family glycosyl hydrolase [Planomicrobium sp. CPCC 101079]TWT04870.1 alpha-amlyase [Planomicrobium sp. CPCC 101079]
MKAKWILSIFIGMLIISMASPATAADDSLELQDESIYDVLVDRFFNKQIQNDYEVNGADPAAFNGGDFAGLTGEINHISEMGFTVLSIGPVFSSASYDGKEVLDYSKLERHFGTEEELKALIDTTHEVGMKIIVDVPTQQVSADHVWVKENPEWFIENEDGTFALDMANPDAQAALTDFTTGFISNYQVDGLRLQQTSSINPEFIGSFSKAIKSVRDIYLLSDQEMEAIEGLDATVLPGIEDALRSTYKNFDQESSALFDLMKTSEGNLIRVDSIPNSRFTSDIVAEKGYPPTRWNLLFTQLFTMPGIPVMQYGSEIAMNGKQAPETHQIMDLGVDPEMAEHITNLNTLRNTSEALRTGDLEVLHEEDGWLVYKRSNDEETWIIAINNSSETKNISLPADVIGSDKEMRGLFENDIVRQEANGEYLITLDREVGETFNVIDERGFNKAYIAALIVLYVVFMIFLRIVWKKGKQRKADEAAKATA